MFLFMLFLCVCVCPLCFFILLVFLHFGTLESKTERHSRNCSCYSHLCFHVTFILLVLLLFGTLESRMQKLEKMFMLMAFVFSLYSHSGFHVVHVSRTCYAFQNAKMEERQQNNNRMKTQMKIK